MKILLYYFFQKSIVPALNGFFRSGRQCGLRQIGPPIFCKAIMLALVINLLPFEAQGQALPTGDPDNVLNPLCFALPLPTVWDIKVGAESKVDLVATNIVPLVGDLSGDGYPEIVCWGRLGAVGLEGGSYTTRVRSLLIFDGRNISSPRDTIRLSTGTGANDGIFMGAYEAAPYGLVQTPDGNRLIVVACSDYRLRAYNLASARGSGVGQVVWLSEKYVDATPSGDERDYTGVNIGFADFNHDGYPEIYVRNRIFDAQSGDLLLTVGDGSHTASSYGQFSHASFISTNHKLSSPVAADVLTTDMGYNDNLELILGNWIYTINLDRAIPANCSATLARQITPPGVARQDGHPQVADFNHDGYLDIFISSGGKNADSDIHLYIYDVKNNVTGPLEAYDYYGDNRFGISGKSLALITDLNNNDSLDIIIQFPVEVADRNNRHFNRYAVAPNTLKLHYSGWGYKPDEDSFSNSATAFDFNQDGKMELLLTDQSHIRIFDGTKLTYANRGNVAAAQLKEFAFGQITSMQYPVVADVDGDGQAEIVLCRKKDGAKGNSLVILKSGGTPWAPARKVWNQYMYNSVNINEDLTVPRYQYNSAKILNDPNGIPGTGDEYQPFNTFLQQQTYLDVNTGLPFWSLPNAHPTIDYEYYAATDKITLDVDISNIGEAQLRTPIVITAYSKKSGTETLLLSDTIRTPIEPGYSGNIQVTINNVTAINLAPTDSVIVYVNRYSGTQEWVHQECDYSTNRVGESLVKIKNRLMDDTQTVQMFGSVEISVLNNDRFPPGFIAPPFSLIDSVILQPKNGTLVSIGSGATSRFIYINEGTDLLTNNIDSFRYRIRMPNGRSELPATVYIYVLKDENGATACAGQDYLIKMNAVPSGTTFGWYSGLPDFLFPGGGATTCPIPGALLADDFSFYVKPNNVGVAGMPWNVAGGFPVAPFKVHATKANEQLRWTGHINSDWNNPGNWVVVRSVGESPATFLPGLCTNVTISANVNNFPELGKDTARCANILMKDRSMLKNPHVLKYTNASVEMRMKPSEMDRFVMWSAPLKQTYSGDYHYRQNNAAFFGDVFMNFFQKQNPDPNSDPAAPHRFTATFANPNIALPLGLGFNLKVASNSVTRDSMFRLPRTEFTYPNPTNPGPVIPFVRDSAGRFVIDDYKDDTFNIYINGGNAGHTLVQIVNPYMAYLDVNKFLNNSDNRNVIQSGYYMWDGEVGSGINVHAFANSDGNESNRILANTAIGMVTTPGFIPPLQSFFVAKKTPGSAMASIKMSRHWTTTKPVDSYTLRASVKSGGVLSVSLSGANKTAHAALVYEPGTSNFGRDRIDMPATTYTIDGESPLSLYTFSADLSALVINASSTFDMQPVKLGLIAHEPGEYTLNFAGLYSFGHEVTLTDEALNKSVELGPSADEYKFTLIRPNSNKAIDVNDRFKLYFKYTGSGIGFTPTEAVAVSQLKVTSERGYINVSSNSLPITALRVYDANGRMIYQASNPAGTVRIPVAGGLYLVNATFGVEEKVEKIIVQ